MIVRNWTMRTCTIFTFLVCIIVTYCGCGPHTAASPTNCTLDDRPADFCIRSKGRRDAGFFVRADRQHEGLELDTVTPNIIAAGMLTLPGTSMLEWTDATGVTCDADNGAANWGIEGSQWCLRVDSTCSGPHSICFTN
jgi:hypothetical protein